MLVVGASASGIQLADELNRAGRAVTIAVGHHTRLPRRYRGRDILWWLDRMGVFDETVDQVYDVEISREQPSLQLVGHPDHATLDLATLQARGVRVVGRLLDVRRRSWHASPTISWRPRPPRTSSWRACCSASTPSSSCRGIEADAAASFEPHCLGFAERRDGAGRSRDAGIRTVIWATGFRRQYPWLKLPVLDGRGEIRHSGGVTPVPGLYVIGLHFLRRRNSSFIDGVGADAMALSEHLVGYVRRASPRLVGAAS